MTAFIGKSLKKENGIVDEELGNSEDVGYKPGKKIPTQEAIVNLFKGLGIGSLVFIAAFATLYFLLNTQYVLASFLAAVIAFMVIKSYDRTSGEVPTSLRTAVASSVLILLMLSLIWGYNNNKSTPHKDTQPKIEQIFSESGTVRSVDDIWFANHIFAKGDKVKVTVEYNSIQMTGGRIFEPGVYENELANSDGQIMFEGVSKNPSKVTITY